MGLWSEIKKLFKVKKKVSLKNNSISKVGEKTQGNNTKENVTLRGEDLMEMARKLVCKGEFIRAEQLIRDGVRDLKDDPDIWWLLIEIEEPLKRIGRVLFCLEQLINFEPDNEELVQKFKEIKLVVDKELAHFIEYKLAPEFYKLK